MKFACLGSGSRGNGFLISCSSLPSRYILVDCGFSLKEAHARLERLQVDPKQLVAILLTHEHVDHSKSVLHLATLYGIPVWLTFGTLSAIQYDAGPFSYHLVNPDVNWVVEDLLIEPYTVPHDAREPVQFVFSNGTYKLGILTDAGVSTPYLISKLTGVDFLILECNYDREMLASSNYPLSLKKRIRSPLGHLENQTSAEILSKVAGSRLKRVFAAHLSQKNNKPELARSVLAAVLNCQPNEIGLADQDLGFNWINVP